MSRPEGHRHQEARLKCDAAWCEETHPALPEDVDLSEGFAPGRWLGWLYLDVNNRLVAERELRFCSVSCLEHWIEYAKRYPIRESRLETELRRARTALQSGDEMGARRHLAQVDPIRSTQHLTR